MMETRAETAGGYRYPDRVAAMAAAKFWSRRVALIEDVIRTPSNVLADRGYHRSCGGRRDEQTALENARFALANAKAQA